MGDGEIKFLLNEKNHTKSCEKIGSKPKKLAERCLITAVKDFCCETCTIKSAEKLSAAPTKATSAKPSAMPSNFPSFKPSAVSEPSASLNNTKPNSTPGKPKQNSIGEDPDPSATIPNDIPLLMVA